MGCVSSTCVTEEYVGSLQQNTERPTLLPHQVGYHWTGLRPLDQLVDVLTSGHHPHVPPSPKQRSTSHQDRDLLKRFSLPVRQEQGAVQIQRAASLNHDAEATFVPPSRPQSSRLSRSVQNLLNRFMSQTHFENHEKKCSTERLCVALETMNSEHVSVDAVSAMLHEVNGVKQGEHRREWSTDEIKALFTHPEFNLLEDESANKQLQSDEYPLSEYYISTSHNTYLFGGQYTVTGGRASVEAYKQAILRGCRCVELDCYDGANGQPIITHFSAKVGGGCILFLDAVKCIAEHAFSSHEYPFILNIENHVVKQSLRMAEILERELGDRMVTTDDPEFGHHLLRAPGSNKLPTLAQLKGRVLCRAKVILENSATPEKPEAPTNQQEQQNPPDGSKAQLDSSSTPSPPQTNGEKKRVPLFFTPTPLARLIYLRNMSVKLMRSPTYEPQPWHTCSVSEKKVPKLMKEVHADVLDWIVFTSEFLTRVYPKSSAVSSQNYCPAPMWAYGFQLVALNYQTDGEAMAINDCMFRRNGGRGFVLKPTVTRISAAELRQTESLIRKTVSAASIRETTTNKLLQLARAGSSKSLVSRGRRWSDAGFSDTEDPGTASASTATLTSPSSGFVAKFPQMRRRSMSLSVSADELQGLTNFGPDAQDSKDSDNRCLVSKTAAPEWQRSTDNSNETLQESDEESDKPVDLELANPESRDACGSGNAVQDDHVSVSVGILGGDQEPSEASSDQQSLRHLSATCEDSDRDADIAEPTQVKCEEPTQSEGVEPTQSEGVEPTQSEGVEPTYSEGVGQPPPPDTPTRANTDENTNPENHANRNRQGADEDDGRVDLQSLDQAERENAELTVETRQANETLGGGHSLKIVISHVEVPRIGATMGLGKHLQSIERSGGLSVSNGVIRVTVHGGRPSVLTTKRVSVTQKSRLWWGEVFTVELNEGRLSRSMLVDFDLVEDFGSVNQKVIASHSMFVHLQHNGLKECLMLVPRGQIVVCKLMLSVIGNPQSPVQQLPAQLQLFNMLELVILSGMPTKGLAETKFKQRLEKRGVALDPYVVIKVFGLQQDIRKLKTNPASMERDTVVGVGTPGASSQPLSKDESTWMTPFAVPVLWSEGAFLQIAVKMKVSGGIGAKRRHTIGTMTLWMHAVRNGTRAVAFRNETGKHVYTMFVHARLSQQSLDSSSKTTGRTGVKLLEQILEQSNGE